MRKILSAEKIDRRLMGLDPFIFGAYNRDDYPAGNGALGPASELLVGRQIGMDFEPIDGWRMYHGQTVPGFPAHPHCGFETVTIVPKGLVDHADSLGCSARYGEGDVQWLTTGRGVQHGEMFPLVHEGEHNPLELCQIWLNLPPEAKECDPGFKMFWANNIPVYSHIDVNGFESSVKVIAGDYTPVGGSEEVLTALAPPKDSWASNPEANLAIWLVTLCPGAELEIPAADQSVRRALYVLHGSGLSIAGQHFDDKVMVEVKPDEVISLRNQDSDAIEVLALQGKPIGAPVVAQGPFVMNSEQGLLEAIQRFRETEFGGWPWPVRDQTFGNAARFARFNDGVVDQP